MTMEIGPVDTCDSRTDFKNKDWFLLMTNQIKEGNFIF